MSIIAIQPLVFPVPILLMNQWAEFNEDRKHVPHTSNSGEAKWIEKHKFMNK